MDGLGDGACEKPRDEGADAEGNDQADGDDCGGDAKVAGRVGGIGADFAEGILGKLEDLGEGGGGDLGAFFGDGVAFLLVLDEGAQGLAIGVAGLLDSFELLNVGRIARDRSEFADDGGDLGEDRIEIGESLGAAFGLSPPDSESEFVGGVVELVDEFELGGALGEFLGGGSDGGFVLESLLLCGRKAH